MKRRSLGFKLIFGGVITVLIPMLAIGILSIYKASQAIEKTALDGTRNIAVSLAGMVNMQLTEELKIALELSVGNTTIAAVSKIELAGIEYSAREITMLDVKLTSAMKQIGTDYEGIFVADMDGVIYSDGVGGGYKGISVTDRPYFQTAKSGKANIGTPVKSKKTGQPVITIASPIMANAGHVAGVLGIVMKTDIVAAKILSVKIGETGYAFLIDQTGLIVVHPNAKNVLELNVTHVPEMKVFVDKMLARQTGVESYRFEGIDKIAGFAPVDNTGWSIGATQSADEFLADVYTTRNAIIIMAVIFLVIAIFICLYFSRSLTIPIYRVIDSLNEGADQVSSASTQVSSASQSLAEGASEQAASIEETSSSLEEMSSMTKQNASNAGQANSMMTEAVRIVHSATESMTELTTAMKDMSKASEETSKIIKTIDEIAFQTNLLALNAAVEAARAGEAGAGFAVVADEVRNLARRAAEAAGQTSGLIEGTIKQVKESSQLVNRTSAAFAKVSSSTTKVGELLAEISTASGEQAQGIQELNTAVTEMDRVTQQNAANAEESASASEELNAQAHEMKDMVEKLVYIVGGGLQKTIQMTPSESLPVKKSKKIQHVQAGGLPRAGKKPAPKTKEISPSELIPFDDDELSHF
ncbi:MAG: methyl-accepting chemotaxis protein [Desulfatirhabdiaceae bacterium]